jgi:hypothetical protein
MPILSLTDVGVRALEHPTKGQVTYWDASLKSFGLRISQGGSRSWVVLVGPERRRLTIGRYPLISLAEARKQARVLLAEAALRKFQPARTPFDEAKRDFLAECVRKNKPRTVKDYTWLLDRYLDFGRRVVGDIEPREITQILNRLNDTPSVKRHVFVVARAFFRWCVRQDLLERSPLERVTVPVREVSRDRVLDDRELRRLLPALTSAPTPFKSICLLLLPRPGTRRPGASASPSRPYERPHAV